MESNTTIFLIIGVIVGLFLLVMLLIKTLKFARHLIIIYILIVIMVLGYIFVVNEDIKNKITQIFSETF